MHAVKARVNFNWEMYLLHAQCNAWHETLPVQSQRCFQGTYVLRFEKIGMKITASVSQKRQSRETTDKFGRAWKRYFSVSQQAIQSPQPQVPGIDGKLLNFRGLCLHMYTIAQPIELENARYSHNYS